MPKIEATKVHQNLGFIPYYEKARIIALGTIANIF